MHDKKILSNNKKAYHDYFIIETLEAGIQLSGTEVKSVKLGKCSVKESYVKINDHGDTIIMGMNITPYENGNIWNRDALRDRRLLLHKKEIRKLHSKIKEDGMTIVPLKVYENHGLIKLEIGLAKGKHNYDKREALKTKQVKRDMERVER